MNEAMKIVYLLLHDFRFASLRVEDFAFKRFHFSKEYAKRMAQLGHDVKLYIMADDIARKQVVEVEEMEVKAFNVSLQFPPMMRFGNAHNLGVLGEIERDSPDVVHLHNYYLWNFLYTAPWVKRLKLPLVAQFHGTDPIRRVKASIFYPSLRLCDRLLVPIRSEEDFLIRSMRIPANRVWRFPSTGVNTQLFRRTAAKEEDPLLLYVGRIPEPSSYRWEKAPQYLLPILSALRKNGVRARLMVVGDGPGLPSLSRDAERLGLRDSVLFLGQLDNERLPELYSRSWVTFVPMHMEDIEPFWGGTLQESLACGTPVIAFNAESPGFRKFGLLVSPRAESAFKLIETALANPARLVSAGDEGLEFIKENCDWNTLAQRLNSLYSSLVK